MDTESEILDYKATVHLLSKLPRLKRIIVAYRSRDEIRCGTHYHTLADAALQAFGGGQCSLVYLPVRFQDADHIVRTDIKSSIHKVWMSNGVLVAVGLKVCRQ